MIRLARIYELEQLRQLARQVYGKKSILFYLDLKLMFPKYIKRRAFFVYEAKDCIVGMVTTYKNSIGNLWVKTSHHNKGVGSSLLFCAEQHIKNQGYKQICLDSESKAVGFYCKKEYTAIKRVRLAKYVN